MSVHPLHRSKQRYPRTKARNRGSRPSCRDSCSETIGECLGLPPSQRIARFRSGRAVSGSWSRDAGCVRGETTLADQACLTSVGLSVGPFPTSVGLSVSLWLLRHTQQFCQPSKVLGPGPPLCLYPISAKIRGRCPPSALLCPTPCVSNLPLIEALGRDRSCAVRRGKLQS